MLGTIAHLSQSQVEQVQMLVESATTCMISSSMQEWLMDRTDLKTQTVDEEGNIHITLDPQAQILSIDDQSCIQLCYSNPVQSQFLNLFCIATIESKEVQTFEGRYNASGHPKGGKTISLIARPTEAFYWDESLDRMAVLIPANALERAGRAREVVFQ